MAPKENQLLFYKTVGTFYVTKSTFKENTTIKETTSSKLSEIHYFPIMYK